MRETAAPRVRVCFPPLFEQTRWRSEAENTTMARVFERNFLVILVIFSLCNLS